MSNKLHSSKFFITLNTNTTDIEYKDKLKNAYNQWYKNLLQYLTKKSDEVTIKSINCKAVLEIRENKHMIHMHSILTIIHTGKIHINIEKSRAYFCNELLRNVSFNVKAVSDTDFNIMQYMQKFNLIDLNGANRKSRSV